MGRARPTVALFSEVVEALLNCDLATMLARPLREC